MRRASGVIWSAATDQREAKWCKEERGRGRQVLPQGRVECVSTKIVNVCIIQPYSSVVRWVFKVGHVKNSDQCAENLCV